MSLAVRPFEPAISPSPLPIQKKTKTVLAGIGTAVPEFSASQDVARQFMERVLIASQGATSGQLAWQKRIYMKSGIERRHSVLQDYMRADPAENTFFPPNAALEPFPSTGRRMEVFEHESIALAEAAAKGALKASGIASEQITHLVISTCTGFFAPGLDILLTRALGLPSTVQRTMLGFMGCYAGLSGMQVCHQIVQGNPNAVVLQVAVELCSLHFQRDLTPDTLVANALFADGAAAAVYVGLPEDGDSSTSPVEVLGGRTELCPDSLDGMSWKIGDTGFVMRLDSQVPDLLKQSAAAFVESMAEHHGLLANDVTAWAIHPGGRRILEAVDEALDLQPGQLDSSYGVLRDYGNMSSATILFVLQRELERLGETPAVIAGLAFGPGLTTEGVLIRVG